MRHVGGVINAETDGDDQIRAGHRVNRQTYAEKEIKGVVTNVTTG